MLTLKGFGYTYVQIIVLIVFFCVDQKYGKLYDEYVTYFTYSYILKHIY